LISHTVRLPPKEWNSGNIFWITETIGSPMLIKKMIQAIAKEACEGKPFKLLKFQQTQ
jgi:hemolysin-activating ACP:hemolysin acyltransferase